nr:zinc finger, CCHC-type [Tanacetum cinerariifolium]
MSSHNTAQPHDAHPLPMKPFLVLGPDIAFVVGKLSRYTSNPGTQHWQAIQRVLKYLKKTMDYRLVYFGYPSVLECYIDASWISNTEDNSSTSGWVFLLGGGPPLPFKDGWYNSSIVRRSGTGRSPFPSAAILEFFKRVGSERDLLRIVAQNYQEVDLTKEFLSSRFSMKDIGEADVIFGISIKHESNADALQRYTSNPRTQHWQAIQRVLKYLKKTMNYRLVYFGYPLVLEGYTNARWISNTEENSFTSGWVFLLGGGPISWASKKQTCITSSIMEYEFVALAATSMEAE